MPTYDGIGETITHKLEIEGDMFLQDVEGGPDSTQVPLEIFSDFTSSNDESINSRMLRLRVNNLNAIQNDNSNIYVADMGIKGQVGKDYFFITAPQNTSNVGDQNTFVISKTSNVGIGTTDPGHYRLLVNNSSTKHFGVPGNDTPTTGDTLVYNDNGDWVYHFVEGTLPPGSNLNEILTWNGANWVPNSSIRTTNSNTAIGIGTYNPSSNLHVIGSVTATTDIDISGKFQGSRLRVGSVLSPEPTNPNVTVPGDLTVSGTLTSDEWIHTSNLDITGNINVDHDVLIDGTYQGTGMRLDGTLQNLRGAIPDLSVAGSITATGDIKTDQTFRGTDASITGTLTASNITHGSELTITSNLLMGPGTTLTASNIVGASPVTISSGLVMGSGSTLTTSNIVGSSFLTVTANTNVVAEFTASEKLIKYPRVKMTAATTSGYTASASSYFNNNVTYIPWHVFDGVIDNDTVWISENGTYDGSGIATSSDSFNGVNGSYITIELPTNIKLNYAYIYGRDSTNANPRRPKTGILYGSTDNSSWTEIGNFSITSLPSIAFGPEIIPHTSGYYKYFRIQVTSMFLTGVNDACCISELELYGYPENDLGDGTSVLFKTVPNTPKTDFLDVYYDAGDYDEMPVTITNNNGGGSSGTPYNVTFNSTEPKSFEFNGTTSNIIGTHGLGTGNVPHSHAVWFKMESSVLNSAGYIVSIGTRSSSQATLVYIFNNKIYFDIFGDFKMFADTSIENNTWYHFAVSYIGEGNTTKIYINGQLQGFTTIGNGSTTLNLTGTTLSLGSNSTSGEYFNGSIANYRLYDRPLSADEVWELYGYQKAYFSVSPDVVTYKAGRVGIGTSEPRAVLDVVGDVMINGRNGNIPYVYNIYNYLSTSSTSQNIFYVGENVTIDQLFIAAINADVIMNGSSISYDVKARFLGNATKNTNDLVIWYAFYDGTYTKAVILTFTLTGNYVSIYQSGARYQSGRAISNSGTWSTNNSGSGGYGVRLFRIII
jgi:hypothetical protein